MMKSDEALRLYESKIEKIPASAFKLMCDLGVAYPCLRALAKGVHEGRKVDDWAKFINSFPRGDWDSWYRADLIFIPSHDRYLSKFGRDIPADMLEKCLEMHLTEYIAPFLDHAVELEQPIQDWDEIFVRVKALARARRKAQRRS